MTMTDGLTLDYPTWAIPAQAFQWPLVLRSPPCDHPTTLPTPQTHQLKGK